MCIRTPPDCGELWKTFLQTPLSCTSQLDHTE